MFGDANCYNLDNQRCLYWQVFGEGAYISISLSESCLISAIKQEGNVLYLEW